MLRVCLEYFLKNAIPFPQVSVEKTATGSIEQSVQQASSLQQSSSSVVQKSVSSSVSVSSSQRKVTSSSVRQTVQIGSSTEIEEIDFWSFDLQSQD